MPLEANSLLLSELEQLYDARKYSRETVLKYISIYFVLFGIGVSAASIEDLSSKTNIILIFLLSIFALGLFILHIATEATVINIWASYRINLIKQKYRSEDNSIQNVVFDEKIAIFTKMYFNIKNWTGKFRVGLGKLITPLTVNNYREKIITLLNTIIFCSIIYIFLRCTVYLKFIAIPVAGILILILQIFYVFNYYKWHIEIIESVAYDYKKEGSYD